jgi:hypothetical protein
MGIANSTSAVQLAMHRTGRQRGSRAKHESPRAGPRRAVSALWEQVDLPAETFVLYV